MTFLRANRLEPDRAMVLVIDWQEKLLPLIRHHEAILRAARFLLDGVRIFDLPVLATEQYPKGLGVTHPLVRDALSRCGAKTPEKTVFSACGDESIRAALRELDRSQIIITGIETHVCVQQTALDLRAMDYDVFVCADATGSRVPEDHAIALERLRQEGVYVTTTESVLFELCHRCDTDRFKKMLDLIKVRPLRDH